MPQPPRKQQQQMMRQLQQLEQMQKDMEAKLKAEVIDTSAGGGMVKVKITGAMEIQSIEIDPQAVDPDDVELLQDMVIAAVNEAIRAASERSAAAQQQLQASLLGPLAGQLGGLGL